MTVGWFPEPGIWSISCVRKEAKAVWVGALCWGIASGMVRSCFWFSLPCEACARSHKGTKESGHHDQGTVGQEWMKSCSLRCGHSDRLHCGQRRFCRKKQWTLLSTFDLEAARTPGIQEDSTHTGGTAGRWEQPPGVNFLGMVLVCPEHSHFNCWQVLHRKKLLGPQQTQILSEQSFTMSQRKITASAKPGINSWELWDRGLPLQPVPYAAQTQQPGTLRALVCQRQSLKSNGKKVPEWKIQDICWMGWAARSVVACEG